MITDNRSVLGKKENCDRLVIVRCLGSDKSPLQVF